MGFLGFAAFAVLVLGLYGCGHSSNAPAPLAGKDLVQQDVQKISSLNSAGPQAFDGRYNGYFTQIFGGTSGANVLNYFNTRVKYFISSNDDAHLETQSRSGSLPAFLNDDSNDTNSDVRVGAINIGFSYWFSGLIKNEYYIIDLNQQRIPVDSPRVGIIQLGDGYTEIGFDTNGNQVHIPSEYRQAILMHEARHSDCTGGLTDADIASAKQLEGTTDFPSNYSRISCGHLHVVCPASHSYAGYYACDKEAWGAYAVGAVYSDALTTSSLSDSDEQIMAEAALDNYDRLLVDAKDMLAGKLGKPDMTSDGVRSRTSPR